MLQKILIYFIITILSFIPIVIWAYSFSYVDNNPLNRKRFFIWVLWWILSVFPIFYMESIVNFLSFDYMNVFYYVHRIWNLLSSVEFSISMILFLMLIASISFLFWWFVWNKKNLILVYLKNILVFIFFIFILGLVLFLINLLLIKFDFAIDTPVMFGSIIFDTFKLIVFYYLVVAFIEEAAKHFNFLQSSVLYIKSVKDWVQYWIFVALWFSFIENLLYLYNYFSVYWISYELAKLYFFRSAFSVVVHILSSSVVAYYFSKALILYREKDLSFSYLKIFSYWILISIILHLIFDVFLTLWFISIAFLYFIWWYLYVSSIFYKD